MDERPFSAKIAKILERVRLAAEKSQRTEDRISLLAVSKNHPAESIRTAFECGLEDFGESYLQEALAKMEDYLKPRIEAARQGKTSARPVRQIFEDVKRDLK